MYYDRENAFKDYLVSPLACLKPALITFGAFYLIYWMMMRVYNDIEMLRGGTYIALITGGIALLVTAPKLLLQRKASLKELRVSNLWDAALEDFETAQEVPGIGKIGNRFFFGHNTGIVVDMNAVTKIDWLSITTTDSEGTSSTTHSIYFFTPRTRKLMCVVRSKRKRQQAVEMLTLLKGRCSFGNDLLQNCPELRK